MRLTMVSRRPALAAALADVADILPYYSAKTARATAQDVGMQRWVTP